jgi:hypothetical protein
VRRESRSKQARRADLAVVFLLFAIVSKHFVFAIKIIPSCGHTSGKRDAFVCWSEDHIELKSR